MSSRILWTAVGVLSILAGILAFANPLAATLTVEQLAGWAFLIIGILELVTVFQERDWAGRIWAILLGAAFILLGIVLLARPLEGIVALTLTVASLFLAAGILRVVLAFSLKGTNAFWLILVSGFLAILLGLIILANFPASVASALGILLAIELISNGVSMLALSWTRPQSPATA
ncbi:DUF308 domain-containing protein [Paracoccus caeni]|uniref:DUF308 domain-containing protein n=1 Tax=Paracoccus caeni TaxID=657651 RepID=A0A934SJE6_9RHOB|nr:DUF308 domain-containing protein [Paracoccus caeni]MBK4216229.1 DUF308 domain-containing protein [Paracoccus caeni]